MACLLLARETLCSPIQIEKQKLKFSTESENFIDDSGNEIRTPGLKATYLLKAGSDIKNKVSWACDLQSGLKTYLDTSFKSGNLSPLAWSNRVNLNVQAPFGRFYAGSGVYFRNKWFRDVPENPFVDIFEGLGFREIAGIVRGGFRISENWNFAASAEVSDLEYAKYPLSNSHWKGTSAHLSHDLNSARLTAGFRARNVDYSRPVFPGEPIFFADLLSGDASSPRSGLQQDRFREASLGLELFHPFYLAATYAYQINNSNNPGFSYRNHQISLLLGTELNSQWSLQAYGIVQRYDFLDQSGYLPFPLLVGENDEDNLAASLVRNLGTSTELELGIRRLTHRSSFSQLNASKTILYAAFNYRF